MSAQVTEKHIDLVRCVLDAEWWGSNVEKKFAQLIADSEAKATAQLRADRDYNHECINRLASATGTLGEKSGRVVEVALSTIARAERAEAELAKAKAILASIEEDGTEEHNAAVRLRQELATERARLDWLLSRMGGNVLPVNGCVAWTVDVYHYKNQFPSRAAIDAAIKEGAP